MGCGWTVTYWHSCPQQQVLPYQRFLLLLHLHWAGRPIPSLVFIKVPPWLFEGFFLKRNCVPQKAEPLKKSWVSTSMIWSEGRKLRGILAVTAGMLSWGEMHQESSYHQACHSRVIMKQDVNHSIFCNAGDAKHKLVTWIWWLKRATMPKHLHTCW